MKLIMKSVHNQKVKVQVQVYLSEKKKKGKKKIFNLLL